MKAFTSPSRSAAQNCGLQRLVSLIWLEIFFLRFFCLSLQKRNGKFWAILIVQAELPTASPTKASKDLHYAVYCPNLGRKGKTQTLDEIKMNYNKAKDMEQVKEAWREQYFASGEVCTHMFM